MKYRNKKRRRAGKKVLRSAAKYLVDSSNFGYHVHPYEDPEYYFGDGDGLVTAAERPIFDALHILACLSQGRPREYVNVSDTVAWLLDEAEYQHTGVKSAYGR